MKTLLLLKETRSIEDCVYNDNQTYTVDTTKDITLPTKFQLEFDLYPKSRSTSDGGASHYVRCSRISSADDIWFGQGNSGGSHGIMVRPSSSYWCPSISVLNTDNHVVVNYDGINIIYTCNGESKTVPNSIAFNKLYYVGIGGSTNCNLKNIKVKQL